MNSEWIKLRTVRMNLVLGAVGIAFPITICVLTAVLSDTSRTREDVLGFATGSSTLTALILGVIGASSITGEFTHLTIRPTFAATPRRLLVLAGKLVVLAVSATALMAFVVLGSFSTMLLITDWRDLLVQQPGFDARPALVGTVVLAVLTTWFGYGLGMVVRNQPTAIALLLLWPLLVESLIGGLLTVAGIDNAFRWLPYSNGLQLAAPNIGDDGLGRVAGGLVFFVFVAVIATVGAFITNRRDA